MATVFLLHKILLAVPEMVLFFCFWSAFFADCWGLPATDRVDSGVMQLFFLVNIWVFGDKMGVTRDR